MAQFLFELCNVCFIFFFRKVIDAFPDAWRLAGLEVRVLKTLYGFKVCAHIKNRVLFDFF